MCNFENIIRFLHFSIALDLSRITHFLAEILNPKNSASGNFLTFFMSVFHKWIRQANKRMFQLYRVSEKKKMAIFWYKNGGVWT